MVEICFDDESDDTVCCYEQVINSTYPTESYLLHSPLKHTPSRLTNKYSDTLSASSHPVNLSPSHPLIHHPTCPFITAKLSISSSPIANRSHATSPSRTVIIYW